MATPERRPLERRTLLPIISSRGGGGGGQESVRNIPMLVNITGSLHDMWKYEDTREGHKSGMVDSLTLQQDKVNLFRAQVQFPFTRWKMSTK